ncbi:MAG: peptide chain release factor N(5)-glutamine methyltransferase [Muribaculaceae bacterium]|nr:peptide chain release factor N(5)-glutamine methyltransferase [Muribaculaceae bacterium]
MTTDSGHNTVDSIRRQIRRRLTPTHGSGEAEAMTRLIFAALKGWSVTDLLIHANTELSPFTLGEIDRILRELQTHRPIQYILGQTRFYGMDLKVNESTLIPRPETEELIDLILDRYRDHKDLRVLDIGTGSGCIAIALARHLPFSQVTAIDISSDALAVARENAKALHAGIRFMQLDILTAPSATLSATGRYDIIVSNPPYICDREKAEMEPNVLDYEPSVALFVPDNDPLLFYNAISDIALRILADDGTLYFEINPLYCGEIEQMLQAKGYVDILTVNDISHRPRMISARIKPQK